MAEAFPSLILDNVLKQLESPVFQSKNLNCRLRTQLRELRPKLELIREIIDDAELMAIIFPDVVRECVCKLQRLLYELDDLLDEAHIRWMPASGGMDEKARLYFCNMPFHLTLAHRMKNIKMRLEGIVKEWYERNLIVEEPVGQPQPSSTNGGKYQISVVRKGIIRYNPDCVKDEEFHMVGRDDDKQKVIAMLLDEDSNVSIGITGDRGVGKTTLCRAVYIDEDVRNRFETRMWVRVEGVSECFSIIFWKKIITQLRPDETHLYDEMENKEQLIDRIDGLVAGRKTLFVLDGYPNFYHCSGDGDNWDDLEMIAERHKGSKILVSTPKTEGYSTDILLNFLPEEHLWSIFEKNAFVPGHDKAGQFIAEWKIAAGKQIVRRCGGNPALVRGAGTLLYEKEHRDLWEYFAADFDFECQHKRYSALSGVCELFAKCQQSIGYLSLFLENNEIKYGTLIHQLAAQWSTNSSNVRLIVDVGPLVPSTSSDSWDTKDTFRISSLNDWKNLIPSLAGRETTVLGWSELGADFPEAARHISISRPLSSTYQQLQKRILPGSLIEDFVHKRSLLFLGELCPVRMSYQTLEALASSLRYLRVLDLHDLGLNMLPSSLGNLIYLNYLDLSRNDFRLLPKSVCKLKNLRALKLVYCDKLIKLPRHIKSLSHLKNLEISMCLDLTHMPSRIARLTSLEVLDRFVVCLHKGGLRYLRNLDNLKGRLSIELPRRETLADDAEQANLERKVGLTALEFKWQCTASGAEENEDYDVLEKLKPFNSIKNLSILRFGGAKLSSWIASLELLTEITISQCTRCKILPPLHRMPCLKSITLTSMNIEYLADDNCNGDGSCVVTSTSTVFFPSLEELRIGRMPNLKGWRSRDMEITGFELPSSRKITNLEIWNCPNLTMVPPFSWNSFYSTFQDVPEKMLQSIDLGTYQGVNLISIEDMISLPNQFIVKFPEHLSIKDCKRLKMLLANEVKGVEEWKSLTDCFQRLEGLDISNCPALKHLSSDLRNLTNLTSLRLSKCSEELDCLYEEDEAGMPWKAIHCLSQLKIEGFENLVALPKGIQHLHSLERLVIRDCKALKHLSSSLRHLSNLDYLEISKCNEEFDCLYKEDKDGMPWKALRKLRILEIKGFENLVALSNDLHNLPILHRLNIIDCKALKEVGSLPKSESLTIKSCPHLSKNIEELKREHRSVQLSE